MNTTELYRIIEQKERQINSLISNNKELLVENVNLQKQLRIYTVSYQREQLIDFLNWKAFSSRIGMTFEETVDIYIESKGN